MNQSVKYVYKDSTNLTNWTRWLLYAYLFVLAAALVSGLMEYQLFADIKNGTFTSNEQLTADAEASDERQAVIAWAQTLLFVVSGVLILMWIYRANVNAQALTEKLMQYTPGWSVGWYFIPIANLWKPCQAMKEIWHVSHNPQDYGNGPLPSILGLWWLFWIVSSFLGRLAFRLSRQSEEIGDYVRVNLITLSADLITIFTTLALLVVIGKLYRQQVQQASASSSMATASLL